ncbi:hypothetical protein H8356DRAFT_1672151 [Neocallimastix lanati (nom. inval.)]|jgi:heat shock protein beta-11|uniref:F5/8 type C domain-containing protein n=1 Tax=Neocallimastix californiae TaxID=1754190 RepID=A0A1Y2FEE6_9FUNG|nr:hypothetical protein H8356DRAFT_1672151 [Neocallimastix sp. JGI-2020a]ORY82293.1 hypothetical protein LY90DRAFT_664143 [Neocallimastix californiae]|eukprot:ORY82293.1 hypothetical protein LY90DRAFT_664143 [Neocallimastix californiae]
MITTEIENSTNLSHSPVNVTEDKQFKMKVLMATSLDSRHGMENILDGRINTFWISTGLFPQEIIVALSTSVLLKTVTLTTMKVSHVILEASNTNIKEFHTVNSQEIQDGTIQTTSFSIPPGTKARYLKFIFKKGYSEFITVHKLNVIGDPILEPTKEKISKSKLKNENKLGEDKEKILVRQNIDNSSNIKINKSGANMNDISNSNSSSIAEDIENVTSTPTPRHKKKIVSEDGNLTDISTELQPHKSSSSLNSRRESRKLSRSSTHNKEEGSSSHHSKEKARASSKLRESTTTDDY